MSDARPGACSLTSLAGEMQVDLQHEIASLVAPGLVAMGAVLVLAAWNAAGKEVGYQ